VRPAHNYFLQSETEGQKKTLVLVFEALVDSDLQGKAGTETHARQAPPQPKPPR